jgi:autotransporter-associated beta strand protein
MRLLLRVSLLFLVACLVGATPLHANSPYDDAANGDWDSGDTWGTAIYDFPGLVPGDVVNIDSNTVDIKWPLVYPPLSSLSITAFGKLTMHYNAVIDVANQFLINGELSMYGNTNASTAVWAWIGQNGTGHLVINEGAGFTADAIDIGESGGGAYGSVVLNDYGSMTSTNSGIWISNYAGAYGEVTLNGSSRVTCLNDEIEVPWSGTGKLTAGDGTSSHNAVVDCKQILLGYSADSISGTINLKTGGTIKTNKIYTDSAPLQSIVNFNGGTLTAKSNDSVGNEFIANNGMARTFQLNVLDGGAKIDTADYNVTIKEPLRHGTLSTSSVDGGLTKLGSGILKLPAASSYTGPTILEEGTIKLAVDDALPSDPDLVTKNNTFTGYASTTLDLNGHNQTIVPTVAGPNAATVINSSGVDPTLTIRTPKPWAVTYTGAIQGAAVSVTKTGGGNLTLAGPNTYGGVTTVQAGTLELTPAATPAIIMNGGVDIQNDWTQVVFEYNDGVNTANMVEAELTVSFAGGGPLAWTPAAGGKIYSATSAVACHLPPPLGRTLGWKDFGPDVGVVVMQTMPGDCDLNGIVNFADFVTVLANFNAPRPWPHWVDGDFNYNGIVDFADFNMVLAYFPSAMVPVPGLLESLESDPNLDPAVVDALRAHGLIGVPEPGTLALLTVGLLGLLVCGRRRRA